MSSTWILILKPTVYQYQEIYKMVQNYLQYDYKQLYLYFNKKIYYNYLGSFF